MAYSGKRIADVAKTQTQRTNEYRARIKEERDALLLEIAELKNRLAEREDTQAQPSPLEKLSPDARAEFDQWRPKLAGETDAQKLTDFIEYALRTAANNRAKTVAKQIETQAPVPAPQPSPEELSEIGDDLAAEEVRRARPAPALKRLPPGLTISDAQLQQELANFSHYIEDVPVNEELDLSK
jgi:hypothetical protein